MAETAVSNVDITKELKTFSPNISKASFVGDFLFVFFRTPVKSGTEELKNSITNHLLGKHNLSFSFIKSEVKPDTQWIFKQDEHQSFNPAEITSIDDVV